MEDALAIFNYFRREKGAPLDMEYYRKLNLNGFDLTPDTTHMERVAAKYQERYKEDLFSSNALASPEVSYAFSSHSVTPATYTSPVSYATPVSYASSSYSATPVPYQTTSYQTVPAVETGASVWSEWTWSEHYQRNYRYRETPQNRAVMSISTRRMIPLQHHQMCPNPNIGHLERGRGREKEKERPSDES